MTLRALLAVVASATAFADAPAALAAEAAVPAGAAAVPAPRTLVAPRPEPLGAIEPATLPRAPEVDLRAAPGVVPNVLLDTGDLVAGVPPGEPQALPVAPPADAQETDAPAAFPAIDVRFDGVSDGWVPPDPVMAAGRNHVVQLINARVAIYDKSGHLLSGPFSLESFFGIPSQFFDFDPLAIYDPFSDRYIVAAAADYSAGNDSRIYLAFSQTGDATGAWNRYFIDADAGQAGFWADYPSIRLDRNAVYVTANMFGRSSGFNVTLFVYDKEDGYAGRPLDNTHLIDVRTSGGGSPYRLRPAMVPETVAGDAYFLAHADSSIGSALNVFKLTGNRFAGPTLTASSVATPSFFFAPNKGRQPGGGAGVETLGSSVWNAFVRNGRLWTAQAVRPSSDSIAWVHRIDVRGASPVREQTYSVARTGADLYMPHVVPDVEDNDFALLSAYSSSAVYVTGLYTNVGADGVTRASESLATGAYRNDSGRYGDYFAIGVDGIDPNRIWMMAHSFHVSGGVGRMASVRFEDVAAPTLPPPVPDGKYVAGTPTRVSRSGAANVTVTWDATRCVAPGHHLVWFDLGGMASYTIAATTCGVGSAGSWTGAPPAGNVGVVVVSDDGAATEGSYGRTSAGQERPASTAACGQSVKRADGVCP